MCRVWNDSTTVLGFETTSESTGKSSGTFQCWYRKCFLCQDTEFGVQMGLCTQLSRTSTTPSGLMGLTGSGQILCLCLCLFGSAPNWERQAEWVCKKDNHLSQRVLSLNHWSVERMCAVSRERSSNLEGSPATCMGLSGRNEQVPMKVVILMQILGDLSRCLRSSFLVNPWHGEMVPHTPHWVQWCEYLDLLLEPKAHKNPVGSWWGQDRVFPWLFCFGFVWGTYPQSWRARLCMEWHRMGDQTMTNYNSRYTFALKPGMAK